MTFKLTELPYDRDALEPHISARTLDYHHGRHHKDYVDKLNRNIAGTKYENMGIEEVIRASWKSDDKPVYNNASQAWNHTFLWDSMKPGGDGIPTGSLSRLVDDQFGGLDAFREQFRESATAQFGSGWTWLIADDDALAIVSTADADSPLTAEAKPLLTLDVWEHAYYLDYQNSRDKYVDAFLENLINWEFAQANLDALGARDQLRASR
jgi:Fe-Mn family superoxide dismutase